MIRARSLLVAGCGFILSPLWGMEAHYPEPRHGLHFTNAVTVWDEALPLGNGMLGALVWGNGQPLKISLDRTDLWDLTPVPEFHSQDYTYQRMREWHEQGRHADLVRLYEQPYHRPAPTKIPAGRLELVMPGAWAFHETSLDLAHATASMTFAGGATTRIFLHATQPIGMIQIRASSLASAAEGVSVRLVPPPFAGQVNEAARGGIGAGDLTQLGYPGPALSQGDHWRAFAQTGALGFEFAVCVAWRERSGNWEGAWTVASSFEGPDPLARAKSRVEAALREGFDAMADSHRTWWRRYWSQSSVTIPNPVVERQWFLEQYKFGAASRRGAPPITLQGPWTADNGQLPPWKGDYHHDLNTQLSYWPCYSGNHLEEGLSYLDWLWSTRSNCVAWTRRFFDLPGMNVPMTCDLNNEQIGGWRQYTHSATTAAWLAQHFYLHWKYSGDREFLRDRAWPYLREASVFIEAVTETKDTDGFRTLPLSSSPEIHDNRPSAWFKEITNYDLALIRWLLGATAELADELKLADQAEYWRSVMKEIPDFSLGEDGRLLVARGEPLRESHRHFSHLMAIHPLGLIDRADGPEARRIIEGSLRDLDRLGTSAWCGYSFAWLANLAARAQDGAKAERALEVFSTAFTLRNGFHCNGDQSGHGYSNFRYRPFTLEGNFAAAAGLQEMLLQSQRGRIEVFPAVPETWRDATFTSLRAEGAFLVSAERRNGRTHRIEIISEKGGPCRLLSPFDGTEKVLTLQSGEKVVLTPDSLSSITAPEAAPVPPAPGTTSSPTPGPSSSLRDRAGCSTLCQSKQSTEKAFETIEGLGFRWVDLSCLNWAPHVSVPALTKDFETEAKRVESLLERYHLRAANLTFDAVESRPCVVYFKALEAVVKLAARLRARLINVMAPSVRADREDQAAKLRRMVAIAAQANVLLTVETHVGQITEKPTEAIRLCRDVPGLGLTLDPSHYYAGPNQGASCDELLPLVQGTGFRAGGMSWDRIQLPWGEGPIDFAGIVRKMEKAGYQGFYVCEYLEGFNAVDAVEQSRKFYEWIGER